jgi:hypothetical protein
MDIALTRTVSLLGVAILVAIIARRLRLPYTVGLEARIVYLPRIRYVIDINAPKRISQGLEQGARARHFVRAFNRKVEKPSPIEPGLTESESSR